MPEFKVWNGSAFVDGTPKIWNGSAFVAPAGIHVWDGSAFQKVWPNSAPVEFVGAAVSTGTNESVTIPAHQVGDLIVICAYRGNSDTLPTKPTASGTVPAWVDIDANAGSGTNASRTAYYVATATNHTSGTWSGATSVRLCAVVLRGQAPSPIGGHAEAGGTGSTTVAPSVTMGDTSGNSMLLHFHGSFAAATNTWSAAPTGYTRRAATTTQSTLCLNTKDDTTSDGSVNQSCAAGTRYRAATVEILAA